jgi:hypothetical protein
MAAVVTPTPATAVVTTAPVAEAGTSTSEFQVGVGTVLADLVALAVSFGVHLSAVQQTDILSLAGVITALAVSYIVSRGIRKTGTTA